MTSSDETRKSIEELGYFCQENPDVGQRVDALFGETGQYFNNAARLIFIKTNIFESQNVRTTLESFFSKCYLVAVHSFGPVDYDCYWINNLQAEPRGLIVNLWTSGSVVMFHIRSHKNHLRGYNAPNRLLKIPPESLGLPGIISQTVVMKAGGLSIMDARTGFRMMKGRTITCVFVTADELSYWTKMGFPEGCGLEALVQQLRETSDRIGDNFEFQPTSQGTSRPRRICGMCGGTGINGGYTCALCGGKK